jgi:voltage-gated potassium channel Kch
MSKQVLLSLLAQGNTGSEILSILDALATDNVAGYDYIESPQLEAALGIPTLGEIAF